MGVPTKYKVGIYESYLVILNKIEANQVLVAVGPGLESINLGYGSTINSLQLQIMLLM